MSFVLRRNTDGEELPKLAVFRARCGHRWIGSPSGDFKCPVCNLYDGDHHLLGVEELPVQVLDCGCAWEELAAAERLANFYKPFWDGDAGRHTARCSINTLEMGH
jgi:hypothetical protein